MSQTQPSYLDDITRRLGAMSPEDLAILSKEFSNVRDAFRFPLHLYSYPL